ncbi:protein of unknown function [Chitinophaga terrae (ex Kim and Jung 2007)]|jgi:hypothetical protein|uniref:3-keto-alpha-glucoside-1,2-lyase/3-keto-2-hydroxy-glucal hydratase domain-containing protein n=1 Tax=Chitinophaga terrae (ex Kim and Jung 2007) TaxID=408074 RepID=A0A1H3X185_9BACT|nr:DUF1080 domain-containing protein [Chitinophaga terrae (ex Kim and Jung 2007)]MDQ0106947.1 hypothetical protein [Chitinophaga terrae (ex Kim and Jung 2007)]GEP90192.1 hypothetical protein CTE07_18370 [Chitinophaga terrae (ex Kim and Jung 2007)]SDZ93013.1 protein of unknown function [Chitinophaga terrae (ex Kim and Jung 2007)]
MKKTLTALLLLAGLSTYAQKEISPDKWIKLFNGKDLKDWDIKIRGHELNDNFANTFRVDSGMLKVSYDGYDEFREQYGHIFYKKNFSAYLVVVEYRFTGDQVKGGPGWAFRNSGIMLHGQTAASMTKDQDFPISLEEQLLGGNGKDPRSTANLCTPGTNVVMNGKLIKDHCISSTSKTYHGDRWVRAEALVLRDSVIKHIVEGDTVIVYNKPQVGGGSVSNADPALLEEGRLLTEGSISLQSESHPVAFRKVELFDLSPYINDPVKLNKILHLLQQRDRSKKKKG